MAVNHEGEIVLLSYKDSRPLLTRCDFRGLPQGELQVTNLPAGIRFSPNRMLYRNGLFYFVTTTTLSVIVTDEKGVFREHVELLGTSLPDLQPSERKNLDGAELNGFAVDGEGNMFFTVAVLFKAYRLSPDKRLTSFGRPGSTPGRFGVIAGIAVDSRGHIAVADKLKCAVMVFDKEFTFVDEFGYRGTKASNLIIPDDVAIDRRDRLYVSQGANRGVSVFSLTPR
jgi:hypothetical protein